MSAGLVSPEEESCPGPSPRLADDRLFLSVFSSSFLCVCLSVSECPPSYKDTSHTRLEPIPKNHCFNLTTFGKTLSVNKTHSEALGLRAPTIFLSF